MDTLHPDNVLFHAQQDAIFAAPVGRASDRIITLAGKLRDALDAFHSEYPTEEDVKEACRQALAAAGVPDVDDGIPRGSSLLSEMAEVAPAWSLVTNTMIDRFIECGAPD